MSRHDRLLLVVCGRVTDDCRKSLLRRWMEVILGLLDQQEATSTREVDRRQQNEDIFDTTRELPEIEPLTTIPESDRDGCLTPANDRGLDDVDLRENTLNDVLERIEAL